MKTTINTFVIVNPQKCVGCKACEIACFAAHNQYNPMGGTIGTIETPIVPRLYTVKIKNKTLPIQCRHCEEAPCLSSCPENAIHQRDEGVIIDEASCVGCKNCVMACPFGAISLMPEYKDGQAAVQYQCLETAEGLINKSRIVAYKCDLCYSKAEKACIKACPKGALKLVNIHEENKKKRLKAASQLIHL